MPWHLTGTGLNIMVKAQNEFVWRLKNALAQHHPDWRLNPPGVSVKTLDNWQAGKSVRASAFYDFLRASKIPADEQAVLRDSFLARELTADEDDAPEPTPLVVETPRSVAAPKAARRSRRWVALAVVVGALGLTGFIVVLAQSAMRAPLNNRNWAPEEIEIGGLTLVRVPAAGQTAIIGNAQGRENEAPVHEVAFSEDYWIGKTEVTNGQYGSFPEEACNLNQISGAVLIVPEEPEYPRNCVTWEEALAFCEAAGLRLPTEVEWEYAARGPEAWLYPWGNEPDSARAIVRDGLTPEAPRPMAPAGSMRLDVSWVGAYDMAGSLREHTSTIYDQSADFTFTYPYVADDGRESLVNLGAPDDPGRTARVMRGGNFDLFVEQARATFRINEWFNFRFNHYGFRCAISESERLALAQ